MTRQMTDAEIREGQRVAKWAASRLPLVLRIRLGKDELESIGNEALVEAWRRYDDTKGMSWGKFATWCVPQRVWDILYRCTGVCRPGCTFAAIRWAAYAASPLTEAIGDGRTIADTLTAPPEPSQDDPDLWRLLTETLTPDERTVLVQRYVRDRSLRWIGASMHRTAESVSNDLVRCRRKIEKLVHESLRVRRAVVDAIGEI